ncbi:unnamed protein product [Trypanosoma congolense IL3000]|uniref:WGS project CAEQ00000000 data, annotated contig 375 n=1 Tax=Trypanosoma congolense (strain IL3000) TaxID=1068625 RepID=F9WFD8_TRYCI|nr:unnamed protein product [Trypanosoma congolense IL3000]
MDGKDDTEKVREMLEEICRVIVIQELFKNDPDLSADENALQHYAVLLKWEEHIQEKEDLDEESKRKAMIGFCQRMPLHLVFLQKPEYRRLKYVVMLQILLLMEVPSYSDRKWFYGLLARLLCSFIEPLREVNDQSDSDSSEGGSLFINTLMRFVEPDFGPDIQEMFKNNPDLSADENARQHYMKLRGWEERVQEKEDLDEESKRKAMIGFYQRMLLHLLFLQKPEYRRLKCVVRFQNQLLMEVPSYSDRKWFYGLLARLLYSSTDPNTPDDSEDDASDDSEDDASEDDASDDSEDDASEDDASDDSEDDASQDEDKEESESSPQSALRRARAAYEKTVKKLSKVEALKKDAEEQRASERYMERLSAKIAQLTEQKDRQVTTVDELETDLALERILQTTVASKTENSQVQFMRN